MGESIAALGYICAGSILLYVFAAPIARGIVSTDTVKIWAVSWIAACVALFLTRNFYLFSLCLVLISIIAMQKLPKDERVFLYIVLMFVAPHLVVRVPGFAGINTLLDLTPQRVLAATILVPLLPELLRQPVPNRMKLIDKLVILITILVTVLSYRHVEATFTDTIRRGISNTLDIAVPYFAFSRAITSLADLRKGYMAFVFGLIPYPVIGLLEFVRHWRAFNPVLEGWGVHIIQYYLFREGMLRAAGPAIEAIAFGFVCMVGMGCLLMLVDRKHRTIRVTGTMVALMAGMIMSLSRGPWVGAVAMICVYVLARPKALSTTMRFSLIGVLLLIPVMMSPLGDHIVRYLPFVGNVEEGNVEYRQQLIDNSLAVITRYPFFGSANFLDEPEMLVMRQGQGIIDVVNTYVAFALEFGLVTLTIFLIIFASVSFSAFRQALRPGPLGDLARQWLAITTGILVTIVTVSSVSYIPLTYWIFAGFGVAIARMAAMSPEMINKPLPVAPPKKKQSVHVIGAGAYAKPASSQISPDARGSA